MGDLRFRSSLYSDWREKLRRSWRRLVANTEASSPSKKQTLVPRITGSLRCAFLPPLPSHLFPIVLRFTGIWSYIKLCRKERGRKKDATYYLGVEHVAPGGLLYERGRDALQNYWMRPLNEIDSAGSYRVPPSPPTYFCHAYVLFGNIIALPGNLFRYTG